MQHRARARERKTPKNPQRTEGRYLRSRRRLHIEGEEWRYKVTSGCVLIWDPKGNKTLIWMDVFTGWDNWTLEKAAYKGYWPEIKPSDVKDYILSHDFEGPDCPGSGEEQIPPWANDEHTYRKFLPEQLVCSVCGERIHPVMWERPAHKRKKACT